MMPLKVDGMWIVLMALTLLMGIVIGFNLARGAFERDCQKVGVTIIHDTVYTCSQGKTSNAEVSK